MQMNETIGLKVPQMLLETNTADAPAAFFLL